MIVLFFGQPGSGKTPIASEIINKRKPIFLQNLLHIDGDDWRTITNNKDYSKQGRLQNLQTAFNMALFMEQKGFTPILSFVTPYEELRQYLQSKTKLVQIYLYYDADRGKQQYFATDFEDPKGECLQLNTSVLNFEECVENAINYIRKYTK